MSEHDRPEIGSIGWCDLTVAEAPRIRDFYAAVVGWKPEDVPMSDYCDFNMTVPGSGRPVAGVCHARGENADLPAQWLIYAAVTNLEESLDRCLARGGRVVSGPRSMGTHGRLAVIQDPAGAVAGLFQFFEIDGDPGTAEG